MKSSILFSKLTVILRKKKLLIESQKESTSLKWMSGKKMLELKCLSSTEWKPEWFSSISTKLKLFEG